MQLLILHLESLPGPGRVLFTLDEFAHVGDLVVVFDVVIAILEIVKFILVFRVFGLFLASGSEIGSSVFELALSGVV